MKVDFYQINISAGEDLLRQQVRQLVEMTPAQEIIHSIPIVGQIKITIEHFKLMDLQTREDGLYLQISFRVDGQPMKRMRIMRVNGHLELEGKLYLADQQEWLQSLRFDLLDIRWIEINLKDVKWAIEKVTDVLESKVEGQINEKIRELTDKHTITDNLQGLVKPVSLADNITIDLKSAVVRLQDVVFRDEGIAVQLGMEGSMARSDKGSLDQQRVDIQLIDDRKDEHGISGVFVSIGEINDLLELSLPQVNNMIPVDQVQVERLTASCPAAQRLQIEVFTTQLKQPLVTRFHIWLDGKRQMLELLDFDLASHSDASIITKGLVRIFREKIEEKVQSIFPLDIKQLIPVMLSAAEELVGHLVDFNKVDLEMSELTITEEGLQLDFVCEAVLSLRSIEST